MMLLVADSFGDFVLSLSASPAEFEQPVAHTHITHRNKNINNHFFIVCQNLLTMNPKKLKMKKLAISTATIVEPTGVLAIIDISIPRAAQITETITEHIVTALKLLKTRMADSAGNITSAEINKAPTRFIASTMTTAITTANIRLYIFALTDKARPSG